MFRWCVFDVLKEFLLADYVRKKNVGDEKRQAEKDYLFRKFLKKFFGVPRSVFKRPLFSSIAFNEVFDFAKNHFHKNGLRTNPAAEQSAVNNGE